MSDPTLSIITPSYNQGDYLEKCLRSVKSQSYDDVEHIVIDGGSTDESIEILERYEDEYNLRWVSEPDEGQSNAINKGIQMARGDWIGWQNSDDFYLPKAFTTFERAHKNNPSADFIYGDVIVTDKNGTRLKRLYQTRPSRFTHRYWSMFARNQGAFFATDLFDTVGYLNEDLEYAMDADIFWRILQADLKLINVDAAIGGFRIQDDAKTHGRSHESWRHEQAQIYDQTAYDVFIPDRLLEAVGKTIKGINLLRDRRWSALRNRPDIL